MTGAKKISFIFFCGFVFCEPLSAAQPSSGRSVTGLVKRIYINTDSIKMRFGPLGCETPDPDGSTDPVEFTSEPINLKFDYFLSNKPEFLPYVMSLLQTSFKNQNYIEVNFNDYDIIGVRLTEDR